MNSNAPSESLQTKLATLAEALQSLSDQQSRLLAWLYQQQCDLICRRFLYGSSWRSLDACIAWKARKEPGHSTRYDEFTCWDGGVLVAIKRLSDEGGTRSQAASRSRALRRLALRGLVESVNKYSGSERRATHIWLTELGREVAKAVNTSTRKNMLTEEMAQ